MSYLVFKADGDLFCWNNKAREMTEYDPSTDSGIPRNFNLHQALKFKQNVKEVSKGEEKPAWAQ